MDKKEKNISKYQYFFSMSNEKLQNLLRLDFQTSESILTSEDIFIISDILAERVDKNEQNDTFDIEEGWKTFQVDYLSKADAEMLDTLEDIEDSEFDVEKGLEDFHKNYLPLLRLHDFEKTIFQQHNHKKSILCKKQLVSVAIACLILVVFSVTAMANGVFSKMAKWTDDIFHFDNSDTVETSSNYDVNKDNINLKEIFQTEQKLPKVIPTWLPDDMVEIDRKLYETKYVKEYVLIYEDIKTDTSIQFNIEYSLLSSSAGVYDKDDSPIMIYQKNGVDYYFMQNLDLQTVVWQNGPLECQIAGTISRDDLKKMIDSIPT